VWSMALPSGIFPPRECFQTSRRVFASRATTVMSGCAHVNRPLRTRFREALMLNVFTSGHLYIRPDSLTVVRRNRTETLFCMPSR